MTRREKVPRGDHDLRKVLAYGAVLAPALHTVTDGIEWAQGGFSPVQLWLNYLAFLPVPALMLGLYAVQRPRISRLGLIGALAYGFSFIYFAHTTLFAIATAAPTYERLWDRLGPLYTVHGALMIVGGAAFGWATVRSGVLPRWTASLFLAGLSLNLAVALLPVPDLLQTLGTAVRNAGLVGMGLWLLRAPERPRRAV